MIKGYFTVEAACIMPLMLGIYVFLIFAMFYRYDRCLLEQDTGLMAIGESTQLDGGRTQDRYPAFQWQERSVKKGIESVTAKSGGTVKMPFAKLVNLTGGGNWELTAAFTKWDTDPVDWIRLYRKIKGGAENAAD